MHSDALVTSVLPLLADVCALAAVPGSVIERVPPPPLSSSGSASTPPNRSSESGVHSHPRSRVLAAYVDRFMSTLFFRSHMPAGSATGTTTMPAAATATARSPAVRARVELRKRKNASDSQ